MPGQHFLCLRIVPHIVLQAERYFKLKRLLRVIKSIWSRCDRKVMPNPSFKIALFETIQEIGWQLEIQITSKYYGILLSLQGYQHWDALAPGPMDHLLKRELLLCFATWHPKDDSMGIQFNTFKGCPQTVLWLKRCWNWGAVAVCARDPRPRCQKFSDKFLKLNRTSKFPC